MVAARLIAAVGLAVALLASPAVSRAVAVPPDVKAIVPPGAERGKVVDVKLIGTLPKGPLRVWTSSADVTFEPTDKSDRYKVHVDAGAAPGPRWVRFVSEADGPSLLRVFMVGAVAETAEVEPNDAIDKAQAIDVDPLVVNGAVDKSGDVDCYRVQLKAGQTLVASLDAFANLGSPIDGVLQVTDAAGFVLAQNQDERGFDPLIEFAAPRDGAYVVRVFGIASVPNSSVRLSGSEDAVYRLTLTAGPWIERAWPAVVNSVASTEVTPSGLGAAGRKPIMLPSGDEAPTLCRPVPIDEAGYASVVSLPVPVVVESGDGFSGQPAKLSAPVAVSGTLSVPRQVDAFTLPAVKGESFRVRVYAKALNSPVDPVVNVYKPDGTLLVRLDDLSRTDNDVSGDVLAPLPGDYRLTVEDVFGNGGPRNFYVLDVRPAAAEFGLSVTTAELSAVLGKEFDLPVTIDRPRGMTSDIELRIEGVPELADVVVVSPNKGAEAKKVSLKFTAKKAFAGPIRIVGRIADTAGSLRVATAPYAAIPNARTEHVWLTIADKAVEPLPTKKK